MIPGTPNPSIPSPEAVAALLRDLQAAWGTRENRASWPDSHFQAALRTLHHASVTEFCRRATRAIECLQSGPGNSCRPDTALEILRGTHR